MTVYTLASEKHAVGSDRTQLARSMERGDY